MNIFGVIQAVLDILFIILIGSLLRRFKLIDNEIVTGLNNLCFTVLFPVNIMMSFYKADIAESLTGPYIIYLSILMLISMALSSLVMKLFIKENENYVVDANAAFRGNFIIMSFPILSSIYGNSGIALAGAITGYSQFFYNFYAVGLYEKLSEGKTSLAVQIKKIVTSPLMIGVFLGFGIYFFKINLSIFENSLKTVGSMASPVALLCLGYGLDFRIDKRYLKDISLVTVLKLIVSPLMAIFLSKVFSLSEMQEVVAVVLFGAPTAVNSFVFAKKYKANTELARLNILVTTFLYLFTIVIVLKMII